MLVLRDGGCIVFGGEELGEVALVISTPEGIEAQPSALAQAPLARKDPFYVGTLGQTNCATEMTTQISSGSQRLGRSEARISSPRNSRRRLPWEFQVLIKNFIECVRLTHHALGGFFETVRDVDR